MTKTERKQYWKGWYNKNRKHHIAIQKKRQLELAELIRRAKQQPCVDCGKDYPYYVMDFDHVRGKKAFNLAVAYRKFGKRQIEAEIEKCDVVCSNCHRERTHGPLVKSGSR